MRWLLFLSIFSLSLAGCKNLVEDNEIKGVLTIDKSAFGNDYLEFNDPDTQQTRFIHPGRKIIRMNRKGMSNLEITMMDSRQVQLARVVIPTKNFEMKDKSFFVDAKTLQQNWDMKGRQVQIPLKLEYHPKSGARSCKVQGCTEGSCQGWTGPVWRVFDYRFDYEIQFHPQGTQLVWGSFKATGEFKTEITEGVSFKCEPASVTYKAPEELFQ